MVQTEHVVAFLSEKYPNIHFEVISMSTTGDNILDVALNKIGEKSLFTKELEIGLEKREIDLVVHSMKDLPTVLPDNMVIAAVLEREDPRDAVILKDGITTNLEDLPQGSIIGTSSVRRRAQLTGKFPHLEFADVRGNLNTRFKKLDEGDQYTALILAAAGVKRMGWGSRISQLLNAEDCIHAVSQGAIAIECRQDDEEILELVWGLNHHDTMLTCIAERALMRTLEGGCSAPVAAHAQLTDTGNLAILAGVWSLDGCQKRIKNHKVSLTNHSVELSSEREAYSTVFAPASVGDEIRLQMAIAEKAGMEIADQLLQDGAGEILDEAKKQNQAVPICISTKS